MGQNKAKNKSNIPETPVEPTEETPVEPTPETPVEPTEETPANIEGTFIMNVTHLNWGPNGASHFYADKKPLITAKVMRGYESTLLIWIKEGWVKKGSYK